MKKVEIIVGSTQGAAEEVAEQIALFLNAKDIKTNLHFAPNLETISSKNFWIICTSTHGAGELPDNILRFGEQLKQKPDLIGTAYLIIALGDSSYDTFCFAGSTIDNLLSNCGAENISQIFQIDVLEYGLPEEPALCWIKKQLDQIKAQL